MFDNVIPSTSFYDSIFDRWNVKSLQEKVTLDKGVQPFIKKLKLLKGSFV